MRPGTTLVMVRKQLTISYDKYHAAFETLLKFKANIRKNSIFFFENEPNNVTKNDPKY